MGTSASVIGGSLTIAGGVLTLATAGAAAPLLIAGLATSSVGAATNIGTSLAEKAISSKEVRRCYSLHKIKTNSGFSGVDRTLYFMIVNFVGHCKGWVKNKVNIEQSHRFKKRSVF